MSEISRSITDTCDQKIKIKIVLSDSKQTAQKQGTLGNVVQGSR